MTITPCATLADLDAVIECHPDPGLWLCVDLRHVLSLLRQEASALHCTLGPSGQREYRYKGVRLVDAGSSEELGA